MLMLARTAVGVAALALLAVCAPSPAAAVEDLVRLPDAVDPATPLVATVALTAWALGAWLAVAASLTLLSRAPGLLGRAGSALVRRWAPAAVRRALEVALGITAATGAVGPGTAHALPLPVPTDTARPAVDRPSAPASFDLDWPAPAPTGGPAPAPTGAPAGDPSVARPTDLPPGRHVDDERAAASAQAAPATRPPPGTGSGARSAVVVRPGDTLWGLAEASLRRAGVAQPTDRRIAQTWPRWWAANRDVIGDDPDLILPGTVLSPPAARAPGTTAGP